MRCVWLRQEGAVQLLQLSSDLSQVDTIGELYGHTGQVDRLPLCYANYGCRCCVALSAQMAVC